MLQKGLAEGKCLICQRCGLPEVVVNYCLALTNMGVGIFEMAGYVP
jgi:hypothetical protein